MKLACSLAVVLALSIPASAIAGSPHRRCAPRPHRTFFERGARVSLNLGRSRSYSRSYYHGGYPRYARGYRSSCSYSSRSYGPDGVYITGRSGRTYFRPYHYNRYGQY